MPPVPHRVRVRQGEYPTVQWAFCEARSPMACERSAPDFCTALARGRHEVKVPVIHAWMRPGPEPHKSSSTYSYGQDVTIVTTVTDGHNDDGEDDGDGDGLSGLKRPMVVARVSAQESKRKYQIRRATVLSARAPHELSRQYEPAQTVQRGGRDQPRLSRQVGARTNP